jgi:hypothetical protein
MADLTDLKHVGKDNPGGLKTKCYYAPESYFETIKRTKTTNLPGDSVTIDGAHAFKNGKGFLEMYSTLDFSELKLDPVGERDGRSFKGSIPLFYPGNEKEAAEQAAQLKNEPGILLVEEMDGNGVRYIQCGSEGLGVELIPGYTSGKPSGGRRGWTFTGEFFAQKQYFYEGAIALKNAPAVEPGP